MLIEPAIKNLVEGANDRDEALVDLINHAFPEESAARLTQSSVADIRAAWAAAASDSGSVTPVRGHFY